MARYIRYETDDGNEIWIEAEDGDEEFVTDRPDGLGMVVHAADDVPLKKEKLTKVLGMVRPLVDAVHDQINSVAVRPNEIQLEVGFKFTAKVGVVLAKAGSEVTMKVCLKWVLKDEAE